MSTRAATVLWLASFLALTSSGLSPTGHAQNAMTRTLRAAGDRAELAYAYSVTATVGVEIPANSLVRLVVAYFSLDPDLTVVDSTGTSVSQRTASTLAFAVEPLTFVTSAGGRFDVRVTGVPAAKAKGRATVTLVEIRPPRPSDARRMEAEALVDQGYGIQAKATRDDYLAAATRYAEAAQIYSSLADPEWRARTQDRQARALIEANDLANARQVLDEVAAYYEVSGDVVELAGILANRCDMHLRAGDLAAGLADGTRAVELARKHEAPWIEFAAANNAGGAHFRLGDHAAAIPLAKRAVELANQLEMTASVPTFLTNLAVLYRQLGRYAVALQYARQGYELLRIEAQADGAAFNARTLGGLNRLLGRLDPAQQYLERAAAFASAVGDARDASFTNATLSAIWFDRGDYARARLHLEKSRELWPASAADAGFMSDEGFVALRLGELDGAAELFAKAETAFRDRNVRDARATRGLALVAIERGDTTAAMSHLTRALDLARASQERQLESTVQFDIGQALRRAGRLADAAAALEASIALSEEAIGGLAADRLRIGYLSRTRERYDALVDVRMQQAVADPAAIGAAFAAAERGRARVLLERLQGTGIGGRVEAEVAERVTRLERELDAMADDVARTKDPQARRRLLVDWDARLAEFDVAQAHLEADLMSVAQPVPLAAVQAAIPDDETLLLQFVLGAERSYAWSITRTSARAHTLAPRHTIESTAATYRDLVTARLRRAPAENPARRAERLREARAAAVRTGAAVSNLVLEPLVSAGRLQGIQRLVVVPDGELHQLPFAALPHPMSGEPLGASHEVAVVPSSSALETLLARRDSSVRRPVAILADPVFDPGDPRVVASARPREPLPDASATARSLVRALDPDTTGPLPRLPYTRREADTIARIANAPPPAKVVGFEASRAWLLDRAASDFGVLHLATHAIVDASRPELSGVVLSMVDARGAPVDGLLSLHRLYQIRLSADLVVLSACETSVGRREGGEGVMSLARGFMAAGVPRVLASLWDVDDQATAEIMRVFYQGYRGSRGMTAAAALRRAQNWMRSQPRWADPYYWAGWTLHGSPR